MRRKAVGKKNLIMRIACILLVMVMITTQLLCGIYARFTTESSGHDSTRVAEFNITHEGTIFDTVETAITPGVTQGVDLTITNKSEVAMEYTLTVKNVTGNIEPLKFTLNTEEGSITPVPTESHENGISINSARQIPGEHTDKYILNIIWEPSDEEDALARIGMVDYITISVTATQID